jgi:uncharacterized membrane protein YbhN (UPF0104 family)
VSKGQVIRLAGSVVLLGLLAWRMDWRQLVGAFAGLNPWYWLLAVLAYLLAQMVSGVRWQMLAGPLGFTAPWRCYLGLYFLGMFFNLLLPTSVGGDVIRGLYLAGHQKGGPGRVAAMLTVFADRASGLAVLVVLACVAGLLAPVALPGWMIAVLVVLGIGIVAGLAVLPVLPLLGRLPVIGYRLRQVVEAGRVYLRLPGLLLWTTLLSVVVQVLSVAIVWLLSEGLGLGVSFCYMACVVPLVTLLTLLPVSISGVGLREVGMVVLLAPVAVPEAAAVTLSLSSFTVGAALSLGGLGLYLTGWHGSGSLRAAADREGQADVEPIGGGADQGRAGESSAAA